MKTLESYNSKHYAILFAVLLTLTSLTFLQSQGRRGYIYTNDSQPGTFKEAMFASLKEFKRRNNNNLQGSLFHTELFDITKRVNRGKRIYVIQVGANRGEDFVKGENLDDPVVKYVVDEQTNGLLVEAVPSNFEILLQNTEMYADRFKRVNAAVIYPKTSDTMDFYNVNTTRVLEKWPEAPYWIAKNRIGSFNEEHVRKHLVSYEDKLLLTTGSDWAKHYIAKIKLPSKEPSEIFSILHNTFPDSNNQPLSLLHVDAEGFDWKIVRPFLDITTPKIVVFEKNHLPDDEIKESLDVLKENGFATWISGNNVYAVHLGKELLRKL